VLSEDHVELHVFLHASHAHLELLESEVEEIVVDSLGIGIGFSDLLEGSVGND